MKLPEQTESPGPASEGLTEHDNQQEDGGVLMTTLPEVTRLELGRFEDLGDLQGSVIPAVHHDMEMLLRSVYDDLGVSPTIFRDVALQVIERLAADRSFTDPTFNGSDVFDFGCTYPREVLTNPLMYHNNPDIDDRIAECWNEDLRKNYVLSRDRKLALANDVIADYEHWIESESEDSDVFHDNIMAIGEELQRRGVRTIGELVRSINSEEGNREN